ncbi:AAA family ATPase [Streptomyces sp. WMMC1477]|uniref:AAA family ATPase n=1 Tax=Streptomyces sp. WMMC1477 TaxID=3015155 RepID=UPI0022B5F04F|nr:AAA family ATPase [Streptomyces sp. WMMC1477]MCZ7432142.1 AAA family ATPase [Streptomyces sp. WMMC1477]
MRHVIVIGTSGAGKSTLAKRLSRRLGVVHVELDAFAHGPGWKPVPQEGFQRAVEEHLASGGWVCDGNYFGRTAWLWEQADTVIWLDMPLHLVLPRLARRSLRRILTRERLWNGNRENWSALLGKESVLTWAAASHRRHAVDLPPRLAAWERDGMTVVRLRSPREVRIWWRRTFPEAPTMDHQAENEEENP